MTAYFGLYFGSTNMCLAMHKDGKNEVLANAAGDRVTPSIVAFSNGEQSVGLAAKHGMHRNLSNTVTNVKTLITCDENNIEEQMPQTKCKIVMKNGLQYEIEKEGKLFYYSPYEILVTLFKAMKEIAYSHNHGEDSYPTVVAVPVYFNKEHCNLVRKALKEANFHLLRLISEPSAATLAYNIGQEPAIVDQFCLVFRMGGTSLDVTAIKIINGMYHILSSQRRLLGGNSFTEFLVKFCCEEFYRKYKLDVTESRRSVAKLHVAANNSKHVLSRVSSAQCFVESIYEGIDLNINISRARFESCISSTLQQCLEPVHEALKIARIQISDISQVILAGGSCNIPKLQELFRDTFENANLLCSTSPDEVTAIGAAIQATVISENISSKDDECLISVISQDLFLRITGVSENPETILFCSKGTLVPCPKHHCLNLIEEVPKLKLEILEGSSTSTADQILTPIASLNFSNLSPGELSFSFQIRCDSSISVNCTHNFEELKTVILVPSRK